MLGALASSFLKISKGGDYTASLDDLVQCLTVLMAKMFLLVSSQSLFYLVCLSHFVLLSYSAVKNLAWSS